MHIMLRSLFSKMSDFMEMSPKVICFILQLQLEFWAKCPGKIVTGNVREICLR